MNPKVSIIIGNWNGKEYLKDCLKSVFDQQYLNFKVILVDNGSVDNSLEFVKKNYSAVEIISLDKNYGFAKANNIGIKHALKKYNPSYVLLQNNDTILLKDNAFTELINVFKIHLLELLLLKLYIQMEGYNAER